MLSFMYNNFQKLVCKYLSEYGFVCKLYVSYANDRLQDIRLSSDIKTLYTALRNKSFMSLEYAFYVHMSKIVDPLCKDIGCAGNYVQCVQHYRVSDMSFAASNIFMRFVFRCLQFYNRIGPQPPKNCRWKWDVRRPISHP